MRERLRCTGLAGLRSRGFRRDGSCQWMETPLLSGGRRGRNGLLLLDHRGAGSRSQHSGESNDANDKFRFHK